MWIIWVIQGPAFIPIKKPFSSTYSHSVANLVSSRINTLQFFPRVFDQTASRNLFPKQLMNVALTVVPPFVSIIYALLPRTNVENRTPRGYPCSQILSIHSYKEKCKYYYCAPPPIASTFVFDLFGININ